jgi:hypothetical protein
MRSIGWRTESAQARDRDPSCNPVRQRCSDRKNRRFWPFVGTLAYNRKIIDRQRVAKHLAPSKMMARGSSDWRMAYGVSGTSSAVFEAQEIAARLPALVSLSSRWTIRASSRIGRPARKGPDSISAWSALGPVSALRRRPLHREFLRKPAMTKDHVHFEHEEAPLGRSSAAGRRCSGIGGGPTRARRARSRRLRDSQVRPD